MDKGFVKLVDSMPSKYSDPVLKYDEAIVRSARVSYGNVSKGTERDAKLVEYLVKHNHGTPLEAIVFQFHIKCPIFVQRHIVKHRMTTMNEISARYTTVLDEWYVPKEFRKQCKKNKQSSSNESFSDTDNEMLLEKYNKCCQDSYNTYKSLLDNGVSRELARTVLPQSMYTQFYWKIDLRNLLHFL